MTNYTIAPLTSANEAFLAKMWFQAIFVPEGGEQPSPEIIRLPELAKYYEDFGTQPGDLGYQAIDTDAEQPIGAAWLRLFTASSPGYGYINDETPELSISVASAYRSRGIGGALLKELFAAAKDLFPAISLSVWPENPAYRLYQRLGFEFVTQEADGPAVTLLKRLTKED